MERVHIRAERDLDELILNNHATVVENDRHSIISGNHRSYVRMNSSHEVGGDTISGTRGDRTTTTGGDSATRVRGDTTFETSGDVHVAALDGSIMAQIGDGGLVVHSAGTAKLMLSSERYVRMTPDGETEGSIELVNGMSKLTMDPSTLRITVGNSTILATESFVQINNKTFPTE
jgi:hypothetical protein